jgi:hypothetical protein
MNKPTDGSGPEEDATPLNIKLSELTPIGWLLALTTCAILLGPLILLIIQLDARETRFDGTFLGKKLVVLIILGVPLAVASVFFYICKAGLKWFGLRVVKADKEIEQEQAKREGIV